MRSDLQNLCLEALAERSDNGRRARTLREQADVLAAQVRQAERTLAQGSSPVLPGSSPRGALGNIGTGASNAPTPELIRSMQNRVHGLRSQSDALLRDSAGRILKSVQVVACTCAGEPTRSETFFVIVLPNPGAVLSLSSLVLPTTSVFMWYVASMCQL